MQRILITPINYVLNSINFRFQLKQNLGPKLMENQKPFQFRNLLIVYNLIHVLISVYLFWEAGKAGWFGKYSYFCEPFSRSTDQNTMRVRFNFEALKGN
jgi:hypothetical protein